MVGERLSLPFPNVGSTGFSLVAEIGWLARRTLIFSQLLKRVVSVSLPRLGGWRVGFASAMNRDVAFQSRCRDWVVGEQRMPESRHNVYLCFSLVAEIGWLASSQEFNFNIDGFEFQSRCRDWVVGEVSPAMLPSSRGRFQSRCRDWVVGEIFHL